MLSILMYTAFHLGTAQLIQWQQEGKFSNCQSKEVIYAQNCGSDDLLQECYLIPEDGLCFSGEEQAGSLFFYGKTSQEGELTLSSGLTSVSVELHPDQELYTASLPKTESLQIQTTLSEVYVGSFEFSGDCLPDCEICSDLVCDQCKEGYVLYNFKCVKMECYEMLDDINLRQIKFSLQKINESIAVIMQQMNGGFDDCFPLMISLNSENNQYFFSNEKIQQIGDQNLKVMIPQSEHNSAIKLFQYEILSYTLQTSFLFADAKQKQIEFNFFTLINLDNRNSFLIENNEEMTLETDEYFEIVSLVLDEDKKKLSAQYSRKDLSEGINLQLENVVIEMEELNKTIEFELYKVEGGQDYIVISFYEIGESAAINNQMLQLQMIVKSKLLFLDNQYPSFQKQETFNLKSISKYTYKSKKKQNDEKEENTQLIILLSTIFSFLILLIIGIIVFLYIRRKLQKRQQEVLPQTENNRIRVNTE